MPGATCKRTESTPTYVILLGFAAREELGLTKSGPGNYSRLYVCFVFSRSSGFCFLQLIIPSTAVVITSWVSLWMESETEFQDMISIILAITFLIFSYNEMMPRVSYIKAMDIYLGSESFHSISAMMAATRTANGVVPKPGSNLVLRNGR
ncbi:unnamed protein product [Heligmosomoides polygyrus]|uniref:Neur_chan_memb domain-containing protein n=1 Tax=Heligmosomoides polygyrus TaxID=6339 RepID=A0A183F894_HELPZ|nr:unnamed protein product [Heligmosomoides polygyrus]